MLHGFLIFPQDQQSDTKDHTSQTVISLHSVEQKNTMTITHDSVNHPSHYTAYKGLEVIDLTEQMNFNRGNAVKYIARAGLKNSDTEVEDLQKALWYIQREIDRIIKPQSGDPDRAVCTCGRCSMHRCSVCGEFVTARATTDDHSVLSCANGHGELKFMEGSFESVWYPSEKVDR